MTEDEMKDFLAANAESIKTAVRDKMISQIIQEHRWEIGGEVAKAVNEFVIAEILPDVKNYLAGEKSVILEVAINGARQIGNELAKQMVESAAKSLKGSGMRSVLETIFRGY